MRKILPTYDTPEKFICPECHELCTIIALDNSVDVAATHCTHGVPETWYPENFGDPVCDQCHAPIDDYSEDYYE